MIDPMMTGRDAFGQALLELGQRNPDVVVVSADLDDAVRVGIFGRAYPERFIQVGVAEQNMIAMAAGLSTTGKIPFAVSFAAIITTRSLDQINISVAYSDLNVKVVGAYLGVLSGKTGATHQAIFDMTVMRALPRMTVLSPGDAYETAQAVWAAAEHEGPVYLRIEREKCPPLPHHQEPFQIGKAHIQREGSDVALVATGIGVSWALQAADMLAERRVSARVVDVHTIKPLDAETILAAARETRALVTVEHHSIVGGLGGAVAELLAEEQPTRLARVGIRDVYGESGADDDLLRKYHLTPVDIVQAAERVLMLVPA